MGNSSLGMPRTRTLAAALRQARKTKGLTLRAVAQQVGVVHTTIGRWEKGGSLPDPLQVSALLAALEVTGVEREEIMALAQDSAESDWLAAGPSGISKQLAGVMECERTALHIIDWSPLVIPGVLQTSDYARAIIGRSKLTQNEVSTQVTLRMGRRDVFMRPEPAELMIMIAEPVIRGGIGGPKVMRDQLRHLLAMSKLDAITLRLADIAGEWHPGHAGPFIHYTFGIQPPIVYLEHHRSGAFLVDEADVAEYESAAGEIRRVTMSPEESAEHIAKVLTEMEKS
jgi:transcriptional regulator with XRE-family HTH domain